MTDLLINTVLTLPSFPQDCLLVYTYLSTGKLVLLCPFPGTQAGMSITSYPWKLIYFLWMADSRHSPIPVPIQNLQMRAVAGLFRTLSAVAGAVELIDQSQDPVTSDHLH